MRITERGQLTIPKKLRERFGITPATELAILEAAEGLLIGPPTPWIDSARFCRSRQPGLDLLRQEGTIS